MTEISGPPRVLLVCCGLEHAHRGFESFARECFDTLRDDPRIDLELIKGTGPRGDRERSVPTLTRDAWLARALARAWGRESFRVEQIEFALSIQPVIWRRKPDVIYFSEWHTGQVLALLRRLTGQRHALVLSNGTLAFRGFDHLDLVHEHTEPALRAVLAHGADPSRHVLLPVAFKLPPASEIPTDERRHALRQRLGLPQDRRVVISVAALNRHHKRLDYVIEEIAQLPEPRPFLLLVGAPEAETPGLRELAQERLGQEGHSIRTVPRPEVNALNEASDVFVLASLGEGLPRAMIEATAHGLPCIAHDYDVTRWALGGHGVLADLTRPGALAAVLAEGPDDHDLVQARERHRFVYDNFSWDQLRDRYVDLLRSAVNRKPSPRGSA